LESIIDTLIIQTLRTQISALRLHLPKLAMQLNAAATDHERSRLAALYDESLRQAEAMEMQLAMLEQKEREGEARKAGGSSTPF
jgi:hypothetical protein